MHHLHALCVIFDQLENIYCATQLCNRCHTRTLTPCRIFVASGFRPRHNCKTGLRELVSVIHKDR